MQPPRLRATQRRDHGVTLVGYALLGALFVMATVPAANYLTERSGAELSNQSNCVATRPPPTNCAIAAVTTTTSTSVPPPEVSEVEESPPTMITASIDSVEVLEKTLRNWEIKIKVTLVDANGDTVEGARVTIAATATKGFFKGYTKYHDCVTTVSGDCVVTTTWGNVTPEVRTTFVGIDSNDAEYEVPDPVLSNKPNNP